MNARQERYRRLIAAGVGTAPSAEALRVMKEFVADRDRQLKALSTARLGLYSKAGVA